MISTMPVQRLLQQYQNLSIASLPQLMELYANDVIFQDPLQVSHGKMALKAHLSKLLSRLNSFQLEPHTPLYCEHQAAIKWRLHITDPKLCNGRGITIDGCSLVQFHQLIENQQDYFDVSSLIYDHLPGVGSVSRWLKQKVCE